MLLDFQARVSSDVMTVRAVTIHIRRDQCADSCSEFTCWPAYEEVHEGDPNRLKNRLDWLRELPVEKKEIT